MTTATISGTRDETIDIMKCIGIMAVIVGHFVGSCVPFIYSWHMPLFFIVAGYFFHGSDPRKDASRLLLPYAVTCCAIILFYAVDSMVAGRDCVSRWVVASLYGSGSLGHTSRYLVSVPSIGFLWFLWALFWCRVIYGLIHRKAGKYTLAACLAASIAAVITDRFLINLPFAILPGISATVFYAIGHMSSKRGGFQSVGIGTGVFLICVWMASFSLFRMSMDKCFYGNYPVNVIGAIGGTYAVWLLSNRLSVFRTVAATIGRNSMSILCIHSLDMALPLRDMMHMPNILAIPYEIILCLAGAYMMSKITFTRRIFNIR